MFCRGISGKWLFGMLVVGFLCATQGRSEELKLGRIQKLHGVKTSSPQEANSSSPQTQPAPQSGPVWQNLSLDALVFSRALSACQTEYDQAMARSASVKSIQYSEATVAPDYHAVVTFQVTFESERDRFFKTQDTAELDIDVVYPPPQAELDGASSSRSSSDEPQIQCHPPKFLGSAANWVTIPWPPVNSGTAK